MTGRIYITKDGVGTYLPPHFWYDGMFKIKAGKGYLDQKTGKSIAKGVKGGPCKECEGTIISLKICTSSKGFETTTEKVCDTCGLIYPGAFQVLDKPEEQYASKYYSSHEDWINDMKGNDKEPVDYDVHHEYNMQEAGSRTGKRYTLNESYLKNKRLIEAIGRTSKIPASFKQPMQDWRTKQYHEIADDYIHELQLNRYDAADVHYYIDNRDAKWNTRYKIEDMIYHLCIVVGKIDLRKCKGYNRNIYDLLRERYSR